MSLISFLMNLRAKISVIFDGTTRLGEALAIVVRFVDDGWKINQSLVRL